MPSGFSWQIPYCCQESWKLQACTEVYARYWKCMKLIIFICKIRFLHIMHHRSYRWVRDDIYFLFFLNKYFIISTIIIWVLFRLRSRLHCHFSGMISHILYALRVHGRWTSNIHRCIRCTHHRSAWRCRWVQKMNEWISPFLQSHHAIT